MLLAATVIMPGVAAVARADDPLEPIRAAVIGARGGTACPKLQYSAELENGAQQLARQSLGSDRVNPKINYSGHVLRLTGFGDPESAVIDAMINGNAGPLIRNCDLTEYGVGFFRVDERDAVSMMFGTPAAAPAPPPPPPPPKPNVPKSAKVSYFISGTVEGLQQVTIQFGDVDGRRTSSARNPGLGKDNLVWNSVDVTLPIQADNLDNPVPAFFLAVRRDTFGVSDINLKCGASFEFDVGGKSIRTGTVTLATGDFGGGFKECKGFE